MCRGLAEPRFPCLEIRERISLRHAGGLGPWLGEQVGGGGGRQPPALDSCTSPDSWQGLQCLYAELWSGPSLPAERQWATQLTPLRSAPSGVNRDENDPASQGNSKIIGSARSWGSGKDSGERGGARGFLAAAPIPPPP